MELIHFKMAATVNCHMITQTLLWLRQMYLSHSHHLLQLLISVQDFCLKHWQYLLTLLLFVSKISHKTIRIFDKTQKLFNGCISTIDYCCCQSNSSWLLQQLAKIQRRSQLNHLQTYTVNVEHIVNIYFMSYHENVSNFVMTRGRWYTIHSFKVKLGRVLMWKNADESKTHAQFSLPLMFCNNSHP